MARKIALKDHITEQRLFGARMVVAFLFVLGLLALLLFRYYVLQIEQHDVFRTQSDRNRVQLQSIAPKRGLIYDRNGILLAENRPSYSLTIVKERTENLDETLTLIDQLVSVSDDDLTKFQRSLSRRRPYAAVPLRFKLTEEEIGIISVNRHRLPGVRVDAQLDRYYPQGEYISHVLGYVGRINEAEQFDLDEVNYSATNQIGKIGLEKYYEAILHGNVGSQNVETNARGRVLRVLERSDPEPGKNLYLHLDSHVQQIAYDALNGERGAVVAIDPRTGGVIAMVSTPGFDPNLFVGGISSKNYNELRESPDLPLFNRALQGQYPPASTVKPIYGLAGLHYGIVTPETRVADPGWFRLPGDERMYRDWTWGKKRRGHAAFVSLEQSIVESCDTYYFDLAYKMGIDRMAEFLAPFGYGSRTGIDNTNERAGLLPSREWKRRAKRLPWFPGETLNVGIGQGYMLATPLQLATATAAVAGRGKHFTPRLLKQIGSQEVVVPKLPDIKVKDQYWNTIVSAMEQVVHGRRGTATRMNKGGAPYRMAGKTGTAQVIGIAQGEKYDAEQVVKRNRDHALFVGFAPVNNPKIVVAVIVENGEHGSWVSPVARKVFDAWLIDQGMLDNEDPASSAINKVGPS
ncbi:penicillin-binding protein 2 [bacterium]|nr:penicillin-binding protein 2 [bacterium]